MKYHLLLAVLLLSAHTQLTENYTSEPLRLYLPDDLEATLWAESPQLYNPTNMDTDQRGRIWVTEAVNYRNYNNDSTKVMHHTKGDRVVILEDTDQDGKCDKSTVFTEDRDLVAPLGIAVIGNKVVVSCSPHLIVYTDSDGDDRPDKKEILLTGFGGKDHDHALHSVVVGPDGHWYFNTGNAGPHQVTDRSGWTLRSGSVYTGGSPYNDKNTGNQRSDDGKVWVGGLQMRVNPDGTGLKVLAHGFRNSYETYVDSYGDLWQNDNDDQVVTCRVSWVPEGGHAGYFNHDGTRYWFADQRPGQNMFTAHWHQEDPGYMPAGDNTGAGSPTGVALNEGDGLGPAYRGMLLSADAGRNVIFGYQPKMQGAGYQLEGLRTNFVTSTPADDEGYFWNDSTHQKDLRKWFRPSDVMIGTDGAMYIADWYDPVVGGHQMHDKKGYGRIYRITPKNKKLTTPRIDLRTMEGQTEALKSPAVNVRAAAFEALRPRGPAAIPAVLPLVGSKNPYHRARAMYLLAQLGALGQELVKNKLYDNPDVRLRVAAFRALAGALPQAEVYKLCSTYAKSEHPMALRHAAAVAAKNFTAAQRLALLPNLLEYFDAQDAWLLDAIGRVCEGIEEQAWPVVTDLPQCAPYAQGWSATLARFAWRLHPKAALPQLQQWCADGKLTTADRKQCLTALAFVPGKEAAEAMLALANSTLPDVAEQARYWLAFRKTNDWAALIAWEKTGLDLAKEQKMADMKAKREKLLNEHIADWDRYGTATNMAKDSLGGQILIGMVSEKKLPQDLYDVVAKHIFENPDVSVRVQAANYFKRPGSGKIWPLESIAARKSNIAKGKKVFEQSCATCHRLGQTGLAIGPDLTAIKSKFDRLGLLDAIVNPAAGIVFGYEAWLVNTKDGESIYGFLVADGPQVVVKDLTGQQRAIPADKISSRQKQPGSIMPDPTNLGLSEADLANLTGYLLNF